MRNIFIPILFGIILLFTSVFTQDSNLDPWQAVSVSTSDNLNALSLNPAGLAVSHGKQSGFFIPFPNEGEYYSFYSSFKSDGFGYSLNYQEGDKLFNPTGGQIGFGFPMGDCLSTGLLWDKSHILTTGILFRPYNLISMGLTVTADDQFKELQNFRAGIAFRPLFKHRFTLGADYTSDILINELTNSKIHPFISMQIIDGISLSLSTSADADNFSIDTDNINMTIGFNFGKSNIYTSQSSDQKHGIGFTEYDQIFPTIFKKSSKGKKKYIRMDLDGYFIEENPGSSPLFDFNFNPFASSSPRGTQLKKWIDNIHELTDDDDVDGLIFDLGHVSAGFAKRSELYNALIGFKEAGKEIIVYSEHGISNSNYYLISMADEIYVNELTGVDLRGLNIEVAFLRGLLDTLSIVPEVFRVNYDGKSYKTAADSFLNRKMSEEMKENYGDLLDDLFDIFVEDIADGRGWDINQTKKVINEGPYFLISDAIDAGLINGTYYPDEFDDYLEKLNDEEVIITKWKDVDHADDYVFDWVPESTTNETIAIIYAVGGIVSGESNPSPSGSSLMGDETIRKAIKSAREDENIKAIVLRIDSGGGSALASDQMWREILKTTDTDTSNVKPFIASMSDVAASGGYYIACQADTIVSNAATITGSIGVIGMRLNFSQLLNRIGINVEGIKNGEHADFASGSRLVSDDERARIQESINEVYTIFKQRIIDGRENISEDDDMDSVAMGRVFSGIRANELDIQLVDKIGGLHDAIEIAKNAANITGEVNIIEYPKPKGKFENFKSSFNTKKNHDIRDLLPNELSDHLEILDIIPIIMDNEKQMILPYAIKIY